MRIILFFVLTILCSSCAKLQYLEQGLTLKAYSEEKDAQARQVQERDQKFDRLLEQIRAGEDILALYPDTAALVAALDEPVLVEPYSAQDSPVQERWLYRRRTQYFDVSKVYFMIDGNGKTAAWSSVRVR